MKALLVDYNGFIKWTDIPYPPAAVILVPIKQHVAGVCAKDSESAMAQAPSMTIESKKFYFYRAYLDKGYVEYHE